jgi:methionyl-tRNA synthetase
MLGFLRQDLNDLCISRPKSRLSWGIEIPFDTDYVTYVWFDALMNYITAIGWGIDDEKFNFWWPANYHLIGKDILTTHAVYWSTMLLAAEIPLPKTILAHGWWLSDDTKMSKSLGNVVKPLDLIDEYGVDPVRYFLMRDMVLGSDANFYMDLFVKRYNTDLANDYGNLVNRVTMLIHKNFVGKIPESGAYDEIDLALISIAKTTPQKVGENIDDLKLHDALENTMAMIRNVNKYLEMRAPWKLIKEDKSQGSVAATTLAVSADVLRIGSQLLNPIMPERTKVILTILGAHEIPLENTTFGELKAGTLLGEGKSPFPRIETK